MWVYGYGRKVGVTSMGMGMGMGIGEVFGSACKKNETKVK